jgi:hypothetical protein
MPSRTMDRIDPERYHQWRNAYAQRALIALEPLRKAIGYQARHEVIPDRQHVAIAANATWDHRVSVRPGSYLWALSGTSAQGDGFAVQITDFATRSNLFSGPVKYENLTGTGSYSYVNSAGSSFSLAPALHLLASPRPLIEPAVLNVQITNLASVANQVQLVLWIWEPGHDGSQPRNHWNDEIDAQLAQWRATAPAGASEMASSGTTTAGSHPIDPAMLTPAYHRAFVAGAAGANIVIPGVPGMRISIHQLSLYNTVEQNIRLLDNTEDLIGPLTDYGLGGTYYLAYQDQPQFVLQDGHPFVISLSAVPDLPGVTGNVTGFVKYRLFKQWTPGQ